jgi:hypothetical protein
MLHLTEFQQPQFQGYIDNVEPAREYLLRSFLPNENIFDLRFSYNVINRVYARTAQITGFNADAPLRDKDGLARQFAEVAKVQHGFRLDEEELLRFQNPRNQAEQAQAISYVYDQTDNLVTGVYDIEEWLRAQVLYQGKLVYAQDGVSLDIDFGIPQENKLSATVDWSDYANAKPMTDIATAVKAYRNANKNARPVVMHITSTVEADLLQNHQVRAQIYGDPNDQRLVTQAQLRQVFSALSLPPYVVNDDMIDNGEGADLLLPERRVVFLGTDLGSTYLGPTIERNYQPGMYVLPIIENKPPRQEVYVGETVFPALKRPSSVVHLDV